MPEASLINDSGASGCRRGRKRWISCRGRLASTSTSRREGDPDGDYERKVAGPLRDFGMVERSVVTCRDESVGIFAGIDSRIECRIFRAHRTPEEYIRKSVEMGLRTMQPGRDITTREFVDKAHAAGRIVHVFYADTPEEMRAFIVIGVDGILTNYPERLMAVLAEAE